MKKILLILLTIITLSCNHEDTTTTTPTDKTSINLVTGITCRQAPDDAPTQFGNPNTLVNNKFTIYPNPAVNLFYVISQENVSAAWIVPATPEKIYQEFNFGTILNTNLYTETTIISHSILSMGPQSSDTFSIDITTLEKGYYKLFVKIGTQIYWDNFHKYGDQPTHEEQGAALINYWN